MDLSRPNPPAHIRPVNRRSAFPARLLFPLPRRYFFSFLHFSVSLSLSLCFFFLFFFFATFSARLFAYSRIDRAPRGDLYASVRIPVSAFGATRAEAGLRFLT